MVQLAAQTKTGAGAAIAGELPEAYKQPFLQNVNRLTGNYKDDMTILQQSRLEIEQNERSGLKMYVSTADDFKAGFTSFFGNKIEQDLDWLNSAGKGTRQLMSQLSNYSMGIGTNRGAAIKTGITDFSSRDSFIAGLTETGLFYSTGEHGVISDVPNFEAVMKNGNASITNTDITVFINEIADQLRTKNPNIPNAPWSDNDIVFHFDGLSLNAIAIDQDTGRRIPISNGRSSIPISELQANFKKIATIRSAKAVVPLTAYTQSGGKIKYNQVILQHEFDNPEVNRKVVNRIVAGEGYVPKLTATNPNNPGVLTIGGGVSKNDHPEQAKAIQEGIAKGDQAMIDKAHTEVLARQMRYSLPAVRSVIGSTDPAKLDVRQREAAAVIFDAGYWGGAKWANTVAEAIRVTKETGDWRKGMAVKAAKDTRSLNEVGEIHVGYKPNGKLNTRGEDLVRMLIMFSDGRS
jgi:hypothetical protein